MAFGLKTSNDLAVLAAELRADLRAARQRPGEDPFYGETIVVNSRGMERWLVQELATGDDGAAVVQANLRFVTPNELLDFVVGHLDGAALRWGERNQAVEPYGKGVLGWRLYRLLGELDGEAYAPLTRYFREAGEASRVARRRYQLAMQLADVYDQYQIHRPQWLAAWREGRGAPGLELGEQQQWQPLLWRKLWGESKASRDARIGAAIAGMGELPLDKGQLRRLWVFGISTMAPQALALLRALGTRMPVRVFLRNPSPVYWLEDRTPQEVARLRRLVAERTEAGLLAGEVSVEGNSLLASCGGLVREFLREIIDQCGDETTDCMADPSDDRLFTDAHVGDELLGRVQESILMASGCDGPLAGRLRGRVESGGDASLRIHACHSPLREVEVLRDNLLDWFNERSGPAAKAPRRVVVVAPDIETYVPFIEAVFNRADQGARDYLPYTIADRTTVAESAVVQAFLTLLGLPEARFRVSEVLDLLGVDAVARAYELDAADLLRLQQWVAGANVHWGLDAAQRTTLDGGFAVLGEAYTWQFGLDRLFAGYATADPGSDPFGEGKSFAGIAAYDEVEGGSARTLGCLARFLADLREARGRFGEAATAGQWQEHLEWALDRFFVDDDDSYEDLKTLRRQARQLAAEAAAGGVDEVLAPAVVRAYVTAATGKAQGSSLFARGKITFCSMLPMRSIPADMVWLLGMNDDAFPRRDPRRDFNLIQSGRSQACDRSRRADDRYLFLEALTSARHRFQISYLGRSISDNSPRPPSVLVRELLAFMRPWFGNDGAAVEAALVVTHPLHGFSRRYFERSGDRRLFSFATAAAADAAQLYGGEREAEPLFVTGDASCVLPPPEADGEPAIDVLARFFQAPAKALLRQRLDLYVGSIAVAVADDEPLGLGGLESYSLSQRLLRVQAELLSGAVVAEASAVRTRLFERLRMEGALPPGVAGTRAFDDVWEPSLAFLERSVVVGGKELPLAGLLHGSLEEAGDVRGMGRLASLKPKDCVPALVRHLGANLDGRQTTVVAGKDKIAILRSPQNGGEEAALAADWQLLLGLYAVGMRVPLPFVPGASFAYVEKGEGAANEAWFGGRYPAWDGIEDAANRYCFGRESLLGRPAWEATALTGMDLTGLPELRFEAIAGVVHEIWDRWSGGGSDG